MKHHSIRQAALALLFGLVHGIALADGQHHLSAVNEAGETFWSVPIEDWVVMFEHPTKGLIIRATHSENGDEIKLVSGEPDPVGPLEIIMDGNEVPNVAPVLFTEHTVYFADPFSLLDCTVPEDMPDTHLSAFLGGVEIPLATDMTFNANAQRTRVEFDSVFGSAECTEAEDDDSSPGIDFGGLGGG